MRAESQLEPKGGEGPLPATPDLRARKKAATRMELQEAAVRLFAQKGFAATSVDDIAAAALVSRSTFFRYFGSKEAVLFADNDVAGEFMIRSLRERPPSEDPITAFEEALVEVSSAMGADERRQYSLKREKLLAAEPVLKARRLQESARWTEEIARALGERAGRKQPVAIDRLAAAICVAVTEQVGADWRDPDGVPVAAKLIRSHFQSLRGLVGDERT